MSLFLCSRPRPGALWALLLVAGVPLLSGCGSLDGASNRVGGWITPYKPEVVQGNFVSREQVEALQAGMTRAQVRDILGSPLLTSLFHESRWDYVFTVNRQGVEPQRYRLTLFFKGDVLERFDGDTMPTEAEFVSRLDTGRKGGKVPVLEATPEELKKYPPRAMPPAAEPVTGAPSASYPPLESPAR